MTRSRNSRRGTRQTTPGHCSCVRCNRGEQQRRTDRMRARADGSLAEQAATATREERERQALEDAATDAEMWCGFDPTEDDIANNFYWRDARDCDCEECAAGVTSNVPA